MKERHTPTSDDRKAKDTLSDFCSNSSAPGLNKVTQPRPLAVKIFWCAAVLGTMVCLVFHLYSVIEKYFQYDKIEETETKEDVPNFPDITICDNEPYSSDGRKQAESKMQTFLMYRRNLSKIAYEDQEMNDILYQMSNVAAEVANLGIDFAKKAGRKISDIIVYCTCASKKCVDIEKEQRLINYHFSSYFINCFTMKGSVLEKIKLERGAFGSLSLILYSEIAPGQRLYNMGVNDNQMGMRVTIHEQNTSPDIGSMGIDIEPGKSTTIVLSTEKILSLPSPYGHCKLNQKPPFDNFVYTKHACVQNKVTNECNCTSSAVIVSEGQIPQVKFCFEYESDTSSYLTNMECEMNVAQKVRKHPRVLCPDCHERCHYLYYSATKFQAVWPQPSTLKDFINKYVESTPTIPVPVFHTDYLDILKKNFNATEREKETKIQKWTQDRFYRLNIYFKSFTILERKEKPKMTIFDLLSDEGGIFGLWAGISVLTGLEFVELVGRLIAVVLIEKQRQKTHPIVTETGEQKK